MTVREIQTAQAIAYCRLCGKDCGMLVKAPGSKWIGVLCMLKMGRKER